MSGGAEWDGEWLEDDEEEMEGEEGDDEEAEKRNGKGGRGAGDASQEPCHLRSSGLKAGT